MENLASDVVWRLYLPNSNAYISQEGIVSMQRRFATWLINTCESANQRLLAEATKASITIGHLGARLLLAVWIILAALVSTAGDCPSQVQAKAASSLGWISQQL